jgi:hypothetical protein
MSDGLTRAQLRTLISGLYEQANQMLPVREKSYEEGQRQSLLDIAGQISEMLRENGRHAQRGGHQA